MVPRVPVPVVEEDLLPVEVDLTESSRGDLVLYKAGKLESSSNVNWGVACCAQQEGEVAKERPREASSRAIV